MNILVPLAYLAAWILFRAYWMISARHTRRRPFVFNPAQGGALRMVVMLVMVVLLIMGFFFTPSTVIHSPALRIFGTLLMLVGFGFATWAKTRMGTSWSIPMAEVQGGQLITTGPYHVIRHPIYTGIWIAMIGTALATNWHLLVIPLAYGAEFIYYAYIEERVLALHFPKAYPAYRARTKMLIPYIW